MSLGIEVGLGPGDFLLDGDPAPLSKRGLYGGKPWPRRISVRWGPSSPSPKRGQTPSPNFVAHVYCGQTGGWIKMTLGMDVGLCPCDIVLDGDPAPAPQKGTEPPNFRPISIVAKRLEIRWMHQDATCYGGRLRPRWHCVRWGPSSLPQRGTAPAPANFRPCLLWPNGCMHQVPLGTEVGLSLGDIVLDGDGDPAPPHLNGHSPQFSAHVRCGQTAGWTKMPLGMVVGLGPGNVVLHGVPAAP